TAATSAIAHEIEARREWVRPASNDSRVPGLGEDAEVADEGLEASLIAEGGDDGVGLEPLSVGEDHVRAVKALHRCNNLEPPLLHGVHEPVVDCGAYPSLAKGGHEPHRRAWKTVGGEIAEDHPLGEGRRAVGNRRRQPVEDR